MAEPKWTDGPWAPRFSGPNVRTGPFVIERDTDTEERTMICEMPFAATTGAQLSERKANAHLIAAAPALYAELTETLDGLDELLHRGLADISAMTVMEWLEKRVLALKVVQAKARGETKP